VKFPGKQPIMLEGLGDTEELSNNAGQHRTRWNQRTQQPCPLPRHILHPPPPSPPFACWFSHLSRAKYLTALPVSSKSVR